MQHFTLKDEAPLSGIGLHSGVDVTACLQPKDSPGIVFVRTDLPGAPEIPADFRHVAGTTHATTLEAGTASVSTTEHLLAALWALDVTACRVELDGPEVPILDGSAAPWVALIQNTGAAPLEKHPPRPVYRLREPVWSGKGEVAVIGVPRESFRLTCAVEYDVSSSAFDARQLCDFEVTPEVFAREIAPARTFTLESWLAPLQAQNLIRGGSLENAIVLNENGPSSPFRFADELARHKTLDVIGDLALLFGSDGGQLQAHITALRAGHGPHRAWMLACTQVGALSYI